MVGELWEDSTKDVIDDDIDDDLDPLDDDEPEADGDLETWRMIRHFIRRDEGSGE